MALTPLGPSKFVLDMPIEVELVENLPFWLPTLQISAQWSFIFTLGKKWKYFDFLKINDQYKTL